MPTLIWSALCNAADVYIYWQPFWISDPSPSHSLTMAQPDSEAITITIAITIAITSVTTITITITITQLIWQELIWIEENEGAAEDQDGEPDLVMLPILPLAAMSKCIYKWIYVYTHMA